MARVMWLHVGYPPESNYNAILHVVVCLYGPPIT